MKHLPNMKTAQTDNWIEYALNSRRKDSEKFEEQRSDLENKYAGYDQIILKFKNAPSPSTYTAGSEDSSKDKSLWSAKKMVIDYYNSSPKKLDAFIKARRTEHSLTACPYCGNPVTPTTLDHFIPKDEWAEYSIYPDNLVPQCVDCAPIKGDFYYSSNMLMCKYLHPFYYDLLSRIGFNITTTVSSAGVFNFNIVCKYDSSLTEEDLGRVRLHLQSLNVVSRIKVFCKRKVKNIVEEQKARRNDVRVFLNARLDRYSHPLNLYNNWSDALFISLLDVNIVDYLNSLCPEQHSLVQNNTEIREMEL
ncbi:TPA: hypothetical protein SLN25_002680 [Serratia marcescens]|nr:hypothetical protein [Serratia marcescens]